MAIGADARRHGVQSGERETGAGMVKSRVHPVGGVVTRIARLREIRGDVIRIGRALIVLEMAAHTRRAIQAVVVVDVAVGPGARWHGVHSGEREARTVVVERRIGPRAGVVALITGLREIRGDVIGIGRTLIVLEVAGHARGTVQAVIVVDVAITASARWHGVHSSERKSGTAVIKG